MRNIFITMLVALTTTIVSAQKQVYNVQHYCIDEMPLNQGECDISGNEYSFLFVEDGKKEIVLFLAGQRLSYKIMKAVKTADGTTYDLESATEKTQMRINSTSTKIELTSPTRRISLKVGKSTKME